MAYHSSQTSSSSTSAKFSPFSSVSPTSKVSSQSSSSSIGSCTCFGAATCRVRKRLTAAAISNFLGNAYEPFGWLNRLSESKPLAPLLLHCNFFASPSTVSHREADGETPPESPSFCKQSAIALACEISTSCSTLVSSTSVSPYRIHLVDFANTFPDAARPLGSS